MFALFKDLTPDAGAAMPPLRRLLRDRFMPC